MLRTLFATLSLLASILGLALEASSARSPQPLAPQTPVFTHEKHVSEFWSNQPGGEVARDCHGCHDYRAEGPDAKHDKPTDRCERCHDPDGFWKETKGQTVDASKARVDPANEEKRLFKHRQHQKDHSGKALDCAACHYESTGKQQPWSIKRPSDNLENKAYCTTCHDNATPVEKWSPEDHAKRKTFNEGLTEEARRQSKQDGQRAALAFSHAAHLRPEEITGGNLDTCTKCHASIKNSSPDSLAETQFDTGACTKCHNGLSFESSGKSENGEPFTVKSPTAGVFSHAQHLGKASGKQGIKPIGAEGCLTCHEFETTATEREAQGVRSFTLKPFLKRDDGHAFQGCIQCHADLNIPNHGNVDACAQCHKVEAASLSSRAAMAANRPMDAISTAIPASFSFERQSHKFISKGLTQDAPANCSDCHKAKLEAQPSRINEKPFNHATHLPLGFGTGQGATPNSVCTKCHAAVGESGTLKDVKLDYDSNACIECHGVTGPTPTFEKSPRTSVFHFAHNQHVGKKSSDGKAIGCSDCHLATGKDQQTKIVLVEKIAECTLCHGHSDKADGRINRFAKTTVESCAMCHAAGVPAKGQAVAVGRSRLTVDTNGYQRHEGEQPCATCHVHISDKPFDDNSKHRVVQNPIPITVKNASGLMETPHEGRIAMKKLPNATPDQQSMIQYFYNDVSCIDCHFNSARTDLVNAAYVDSAKRGTTSDRVKKLLSNPRWRDMYRQSEGNNLGGPGTDYPSGFPGLDPTRKK